jgi:hypothetical protein
VRQVGQQLFEALFTGSVYGTYRASLGVAQQQGKRLGVVLRLTAPELAALPWEMLFDPETETYLCRAVQGPQLPDEPIGASALQQGLFHLAELAVGQLGCRAGRTLAAQSVGSSGPPALVPKMHALAGDAELASHLGLADSGGEQLGGPQPTGLEPLAFLLRRRAASDGWHAADPDRQAPPPSNSEPVRPTPRTRYYRMRGCPGTPTGSSGHL